MRRATTALTARLPSGWIVSPGTRYASRIGALPFIHRFDALLGRQSVSLNPWVACQRVVRGEGFVHGSPAMRFQFSNFFSASFSDGFYSPSNSATGCNCSPCRDTTFMMTIIGMPSSIQKWDKYNWCE